jgi:two-component system, NarL family, sensor kinase
MTSQRDLATLNTLAQALSHSIDLGQVLRTALDTVADLLALDTGWVWLLDETSGAARLAAARNLPPGLVARPELMEGPCHCLNTYRAGDLRGAANVNVVWCSRLDRLVEGTNGLQCHASIPLYVDDRKLGILNVASRDWRELSGEELDLLYTIGALVSLSVERTRLAAVEERNRIAREMHDTLAQSLAAIAMQLETADALTPDNPPVRRALALTRSTLADARRSVLDLRAAPLDGRDLGGALRALTEQLGLSLSIEDEGHALPPAVELALYRIAREALTNVARHSGVTSATITIRRRDDCGQMVITDRGVGFDPATIAPGHFGLLGMTENARLAGGTLTIASAPGQGATITARIPLIR